MTISFSNRSSPMDLRSTILCQVLVLFSVFISICNGFTYTQSPFKNLVICAHDNNHKYNCNYFLRQQQVDFKTRSKSKKYTLVPQLSVKNLSSSLTSLSVSSSKSSSSSFSSTSVPTLPPSKSPSLQRTLQLQTLSRIAIPSIFFSILYYLSFNGIVFKLTDLIHDSFDGANTLYGYQTLNLILTDNSNQFIQNVHNAISLIFSLLTGYTFTFMAKQQEMVYYALFEELSEAISLLEQVALMSGGRSEMYEVLLKSIQRYIENDVKVVTDYKLLYRQNTDNYKQDKSGNQILDVPVKKNDLTHWNRWLWEDHEISQRREDLPALLLSSRPDFDPLETILYITSVGEPSSIYSTVKSLRQARAKRLGALQRKMPELNMYLLYILGFLTWITFFIVATGAQTVGGVALLNVERIQLSIGVFGMGVVLGVVNELKRPEVGSAYNVDYSVLDTMIRGIEKELADRLEKCSALTRQELICTSEDKALNDIDSTGNMKFSQDESNTGLTRNDAISKTRISKRSRLKQWIRKRINRSH